MKLNENLDYHDMKGQIDPKVTVDEYESRIGKDSTIVTLAFKVNSKLAAEDLEGWFEIGYDYILDASVSDGEIEPGKWLLFVEMKRRSNVPEKIIQLLNDLETLTDRKAKDYTVTVKGEDYDPEVDILKQVIILDPEQYKKLEKAKEKQEEKEKKEKEEKEEELNEMRNIAGLAHKNISNNKDKELKHILTIAQI